MNVARLHHYGSPVDGTSAAIRPHRRPCKPRARSHPLKWQMLWTCALQSESPEAATQAFIAASQNNLVLSDDAQAELWQIQSSGEVRHLLPRSVQAAFDQHATLRAVADELGATIGVVRQWLADYPELADSWLKRVKQEQLQRAVTVIERCLKDQVIVTLGHTVWRRSNRSSAPSV